MSFYYTLLFRYFFLAQQLTGAIPTEIGLLSNLKILNVTDNFLTGPIPSGMGALPQLEELYLNKNDLQGALPKSLAMISGLWKFSAGHNQLTGPVLSGPLLNFTRLNLLDLQHNVRCSVLYWFACFCFTTNNKLMLYLLFTIFVMPDKLLYTVEPFRCDSKRPWQLAKPLSALSQRQRIDRLISHCLASAI